MSAPVTIHMDRDAYGPGDTVSGTVQVVEAAHAKHLLLTLEYRDASPDYTGVDRTVTLASPLCEGNLEQQASFPFALVLPTDALPNYSGSIGLTTWGLHARVVRTGIDAHLWHPFTVSAQTH